MTSLSTIFSDVDRATDIFNDDLNGPPASDQAWHPCI